MGQKKSRLLIGKKKQPVFMYSGCTKINLEEKENKMMRKE
jgi:hypothetical protein